MAGPVSRAVVFIRSSGTGSMNHHSQHLAKALKESFPVITTDAPGDLAEFRGTEGAAPGLRSVRARRGFLGRVRRLGRPVHFPNHHFARFGPDLRKPYVVTVHDLIRHHDAAGGAPYIHAPTRSERRLLAHDRRGIEAASGVIAASRHTASELRELFGLADERVAVVYQGIDHESFRPQSSPRPLLDPYLLFVGSEQPRKNLAALLEAFATLKREPRFANLRLVKVGAPGGAEAPYRERTKATISRLGLDREVLLTGRVPDRQLASWYTHAECLVLPSSAEGFGLPPLEAMACGCPVVVSDAGAPPEISGPAALVVAGAGEPTLVSTLRTLLERPELRARLRGRGLHHATLFDWRRTARETAGAYERFLAGHGL
jgi:glycosyltransferase involved in cell wall biosynthesis